MKIQKNKALIIVDLQNDFCPGGACPVPEGDRIVAVLNRYLSRFYKVGCPVFATRDWHPPNHCSFKGQGGLWPPHCIQEKEGAAFHPDLLLPKEVEIISKGDDPAKEAYSGFQGTGFGALLQNKGVEQVFIGGLATDYCVKATVLDAIRERYDVFVLEDAIRGVDLRPGDALRSIEEMTAAGAELIVVDDLEDQLII